MVPYLVNVGRCPLPTTPSSQRHLCVPALSASNPFLSPFNLKLSIEDPDPVGTFNLFVRRLSARQQSAVSCQPLSSFSAAAATTGYATALSSSDPFLSPFNFKLSTFNSSCPPLPPVTTHQSQIAKSCRIRTYEKYTCNPFRIRTYKTQDLKSFRMRTYKKRGEGAPLLPPGGFLPCFAFPSGDLKSTRSYLRRGIRSVRSEQKRHLM
jgi:hypothetical protein